jgi:hypothetical protein
MITMARRFLPPDGGVRITAAPPAAADDRPLHVPDAQRIEPRQRLVEDQRLRPCSPHAIATFVSCCAITAGARILLAGQLQFLNQQLARASGRTWVALMTASAP